MLSLSNICLFRWNSMAADFLPTFMYCMGSGNFDVVQTALRNLPEFVLLCQGECFSDCSFFRPYFFTCSRLLSLCVNRLKTEVIMAKSHVFVCFDYAFFLQSMQTSCSTRPSWWGSMDRLIPVLWSLSPWRSFTWMQQHKNLTTRRQIHHKIPRLELLLLLQCYMYALLYDSCFTAWCDIPCSFHLINIVYARYVLNLDWPHVLSYD